LRSGIKVDDETVVGVSGAEVTVGDDALLDPPEKDVMDRIENRLLLFGAVADSEVETVNFDDDEGTGERAVGVADELGPGDEAEDDVVAVTPATIEDEIL
jgi:hypothetical protein